VIPYPSASNQVFIDGTGTDSYPTAHEYENALTMILNRITRWASGNALIREIERTPRILKIVPLAFGNFNAYTGPVSSSGGTAKGATVKDGEGKPVGEVPVTGFGTGTSCILQFDPVTWIAYCKDGIKHKCDNAGAKPDEVLVHEMTHATRAMRGLLNSMPLGSNYDTEEEFLAILVANIYISESGRPEDLRLDHHGSAQLRDNTDAAFLPARDPNAYRYRLIDQFIRQQPKLTADLARVQCPFNPLRRYYELQRPKA
jgi:hypothetical protein